MVTVSFIEEKDYEKFRANVAYNIIRRELAINKDITAEEILDRLDKERYEGKAINYSIKVVS